MGGWQDVRFAVPAALVLLASLGGCSRPYGPGDREQLVDRCYRTAVRRASSPDQAARTCECAADGLIREGMSAWDLLTHDRAKEITRECGRSAGMTVQEE